jgi:AcrR family transcriptional regulator
LEVAADVKPSRRKYHSPLRAAQARETRSRILDAAFELFSERGYAGSTIAKVAERAGVVPETVYLSVGSKRDLLEGVIETAIAGDEPEIRDDTTDDLARPTDATERLERIVELSCEILARTRPIHRVIRGAADKEPFAADLGRRLLEERLATQTERIRRHLGGDLRPGLSVSEAGERYCALASPELYYLLTVELGWTADAHRLWLTELLMTELLGPST